MQKILKNKLMMIGIFLCFSLILEILMFLFVKEGVIPQYILLNICILVLLGAITFLIPSNKMSLIYLSVVMTIQCVSNIANCVMYDNCGDVFSILYFKLFKEAARVFEFSFFSVGSVLIFIVVLIGYILLNVFFIKKGVIEETDNYINYWVYFKTQIACLLVILVVFTSTLFFQTSYISSKDKEDVFGDGYLWSSLNLKVEGLKSFGTWGYYVKEAQKVFFSSSSASEGIVKEVNQYLSEGEYKKSDYFGLMKGKNIITIMMESHQWFAVDEYLTPNIYNLAKNGLTFSNHYSKNKTNVSEMIGITGSYPVTNVLNTKNKEYNFVNSIISYLPDDYNTTYVHPNTGKFYNRDSLLPQLGFDNVYFFDDLYSGDELWDWGDFSFDSETMERALPYLISSTEKFYSFFTTLSMHGPYGKSEKNTTLLEEKGYLEKINYAIENDLWRNPFANTDVEDSFIYYKAMAMDLDIAIGMLLEELKNKNLLDETIIVLYGDHNAYYDDLSYLYYDANGGEYYKPYIFKTPLIISNSQLVEEYKDKNDISDEESVNIEKFVSTYNIVPTLLDLMGYEHNSNLYLATSVFIEENYELYNVFFSLQGGIFNDLIYTINGYDLVYTELEYYEDELEKIRESSKNILTKLKYMDYIYNYNMFDLIEIELGEAAEDGNN